MALKYSEFFTDLGDCSAGAGQHSSSSSHQTPIILLTITQGEEVRENIKLYRQVPGIMIKNILLYIIYRYSNAFSGGDSTICEWITSAPLPKEV